MTGPLVHDDGRRGLAFGITAYTMWGVLPLFWAAFSGVSSIEVLAHRVLWSLVFCAAVLAATGRLARLRSLTRRDLAVLGVAAVLITVNWGVFIWSTANGRVVEASLGYFINPLFSVVLGVVVKGERLRRVQGVAVLVAVVGVAVLTREVGALPWVALVLAATFGLYGLAKSFVRLPALEGLTVETAIVALPAAGLLVAAGSDGILASGDALMATLAVLAGPITAVPLLLFAGATRRLPLATVGLLQYLAPTLQFMVGVWVLDEPFDTGRLLGFAIIWAALVIFAVESAQHAHRQRPSLPPVAA